VVLPTAPSTDPPVAPPAATPAGISVPPPAPPSAALPEIPEDNADYEYEDDVKLNEDAPKVEDDVVPSRPPRKRLQTARINPAALTMLSSALDLLTPSAPPTDPQPTGPWTRISTEALCCVTVLTAH
jgi:hypothetical protein